MTIEPLPLTDAQLEMGELRELRERVNAEIERTMLGGWPSGYEPGKGMLTTAALGGKQPRSCNCAVIHTCGRGFECC